MFRRRNLTWALIILAVFCVRLLSLIPPIIDDDEAWFSASAFQLTKPKLFYAEVPDNKPPGTVWYFWCIRHLLHESAGAKAGRTVFALLLFFTALGLSRLGALGKNSGNPTRFDPRFALLFLLASALPSPKLLAVTNEGLMLPLITVAALIWLSYATNLTRPVLSAIVAGAILGITLLIKQTGIFFILPFLATAKRKRDGVLFLTFALVPLIATVFWLGAQDYWYWNFQYPAETLRKVRGSAFHSGREFALSLFLVLLAWWPLWMAWGQKKVQLRDPVHRFFLVWLGGAMMACLIGGGLFLHYFLLLLPPLVCLAGGAAFSRIRLAWLAIGYLLSIGMLAIPSSAILWGVDSGYYLEVAKIIQGNTRPSDRVFLWGGHPMALAFSDRKSIPGYLSSRFAVAPYAPPQGEENFKKVFLRGLPELFIDLSLRGDNQFNTRPDRYSWLEQTLQRNYRSVNNPSVPWATFYVKTLPTAEKRNASCENSFRKWYLFLSPPYRHIVRDWSAKTFLRLEKTARAYLSLRFLALSRPDLCPNINSLRVKLEEDLRNGREDGVSISEVSHLYHYSGFDTPFPLRSPSWWLSWALVRLQPVGDPSLARP